LHYLPHYVVLAKVRWIFFVIRYNLLDPVFVSLIFRDNKTVRIKETVEKRRVRKPILKSNNSETNDSVDEDIEDDDEQVKVTKTIQ